jgi:hypothetical protein
VQALDLSLTEPVYLCVLAMSAVTVQVASSPCLVELVLLEVKY